ncbi:L-selectin [Mantella aurantiaca]
MEFRKTIPQCHKPKCQSFALSGVSHKAVTFTMLYFVSFTVSMAHCWTYHYSVQDMTYDEAQKFCQTKYTDLVAIQNKKEINHLMENIPGHKSYYWIGIRKINGVWTWVGTNKTLTKEAENWGVNEPNNKKNNEDCVEIYIGRKLDSGKWNDDSCKKKKRALCYTASCNSSLCGNHGECIETINNFTCACHTGFYGDLCQHAVQCPHLVTESPKYMNCSDPWGHFSFESLCHFECSDGFFLNGTDNIQCLSSGNWSKAPPHCSAVQCPHLPTESLMSMNCSNPWGNFSFESLCHFKCPHGFFLNGTDKVQCLSSGSWNVASPHCSAIQCPPLITEPPMYVNCSHPLGNFSFKNLCHFECLDGFFLNGTDKVQCLSSGSWNETPPHCSAVQCPHLLMESPVSMNCSHPWGNFSFESICQFECLDGFFLNGTDKVQCLSSGNWNEESPLCSEKLNFLYSQMGHQRPVLILGMATAASALTLALALWLIKRKLKKGKPPIDIIMVIKLQQSRTFHLIHMISTKTMRKHEL